MLALSPVTAAGVYANSNRAPDRTWSIRCPLDDCASSIRLTFDAEHDIPLNASIGNLPVGGLSGIDGLGRNSLLAISDDRSEKGPARLIKLRLSSGKNNSLNIRPAGVIILHRGDGSEFPAQSIDPESVRYLNDQAVFVSSEGNPDLGINPGIFQFTKDGKFVRSLDLPSEFEFSIDHSKGSRKNLSLEGLALISRSRLVAVSESSIIQDGAPADAFQGSRNRMVEFDLQTGKPVGQYIYVTDPVARRPEDGTRTGERGVSEIVTLNDRQLLVLEREVYPGQRFEAALYIASLPTPSGQVGLVRKTKIFDFREAGFTPDNLEGMAIVKDRAGRTHLIVCSDNNFSKNQRNQFLSFTIVSSAPDRPTRPRR